MGMLSGFGFLLALLFWLVGLAVTAVVLYWVIRLAVRHALRDSQGGPSWPAGHFGGQPQYPPSPPQ